MTRTSGSGRARDREARRRIAEDLDATFLVEAGAGSGKTKSLVDRMIALIAAGKATIQTLAAVTFTRKAAAELRGRFQVALEGSLLAAPENGERPRGRRERERLEAALRDLEQGFIGTIHSFCARLLRERPVECGIDPEFVEMEDIDDAVFRDACWHDHLAEARLSAGAVLEALEEAGLSPEDLRGAFDELAMYPEVEPEPGRKNPPDLKAARAALERFLDKAAARVPEGRPGSGWDGTQKLMRRLFGRRERLGFSDPATLMESLELLQAHPRVTLKCWPSKEEARDFESFFEAFRERAVKPALEAWREYRHDKALAFLEPALRYYDERRRSASRLNFGDQLLFTASLLRDNPEVRRYFQARFGRLLVDEFQDTDPVQAEILFYLTGTDAEETDWTRLRPARGSLFLVGDPKQSIYRFRRADIDTYNLVKEIIIGGGGEVLELAANFRSQSCIADFVNGTFGPGDGPDGLFPASATDFQACFARSLTHRTGCGGAAGGIFKITSPKVTRDSERPIAELDAEAVSAFIRGALDGGLEVPEKGGHGRERPRPARPEDFLILFRYKKNMDIYARSLEQKGIPFEISGSDAFSESPEISAVVALLRALKDPANAVHTVAALRGVFFGLSDQALLDYRASGGSLAFTEGTAAAGPASEPVRRALAGLREWWEWTRSFPPSVALEMVLEASGLLGYLASTEMGSSRAGNVLKLVEIVRGLEAEGTTSFATVVDFLSDGERLETVEEMSLTPGRRGAVRLMNLHKAKGLEAPVVFLAHPAGMKDREPDRHIVRRAAGGGPGARPSAGRPRGYFLFKKRVGYGVNILTQPVGWADVVDRATHYREAEEHRLMYVATTRARDMLIVSTYRGGPGFKKAWRALDDRLESVLELEPLPEGKRAPDPPAGPAPSSKEIAAAERRIREAKAAASRARYRLETVTAVAEPGPRPSLGEPGGRGREWGTAVHSLLNAVGRAWSREPLVSGGPPAGEERLRRMAGNALTAAGLGRTEEGELAALVASILGSEFWGRAMAAGRKLFEVPFSVRIDAGDPDHEAISRTGSLVALGGRRPVAVAAGAPVILSGAIDLVFREEDGWVIADYKSDRLPSAAFESGPKAAMKALDALVGYYAPQVRIYSRLWERMTGERVKESGLYFTALDRWVPLRLVNRSG
jgi:ATP-dependent helicase/nuclease subunit A